MNDLSKLPTTEGAAKVAAPFHYPDSAMTPLERYQADLKRPDFFHDAAQENAVRHLQRLYDDRRRRRSQQERPARQAVRQEAAGSDQGHLLLGRRRPRQDLPVDTFFDALPFEQKMRTHFHRFMKRVHEEMKTLKGEKNPLTIIGKRFADEARSSASTNSSSPTSPMR